MPPFRLRVFGLAGQPLGSRFDAVAQRLQSLPRLLWEPDGSFVWSGPDWQIDGMLYDRDEIVQWAELTGAANPELLCRLIRQLVAAPPDTADRDMPVSISDLVSNRLQDLQAWEATYWDRCG